MARPPAVEMSSLVVCAARDTDKARGAHLLSGHIQFVANAAMTYELAATPRHPPTDTDGRVRYLGRRPPPAATMRRRPLRRNRVTDLMMPHCDKLVARGFAPKRSPYRHLHTHERVPRINATMGARPRYLDTVRRRRTNETIPRASARHGSANKCRLGRLDRPNAQRRTLCCRNARVRSVCVTAVGAAVELARVRRPARPGPPSVAERTPNV